jgi:hypothetical protein
MRRLVVVLAHGLDAGAVAVVGVLRQASTEADVWLLAPQALARAGWSHRIGARGRTSTRIKLPDGRVLEDESIAVVWNRAQHWTPPQFCRSDARDAGYAAAELQALVASWLGSLEDRVLPGLRAWPSPVVHLPPLRWQATAEACGLALADGADGAVAASTVLVAGAETVGPQAAVLGPACRAVAQRMALPVLGFDFELASGTPRLVRVDTLPALRDAAAVGAVARHLLQVAAREAHA